MKAKLAKMGNVTMDDFSEYKNLVQDNALLVLEALEQQIRQRQMRDISSKTVSFEDVCAYADEPEPYKPQVGDRVSLEGELLHIDYLPKNSTSFPFCASLFIGEGYRQIIGVKNAESLKLLARARRKVTRADIEKLLGGEFELVD